MKLSFITPLYNCLALTQAMLESLERTLPKGLSYEVIFVDDGSTDGTREWLKTVRKESYRCVLNERNLGFAGATNQGAKIAQGEFLALINNDLVFSEYWLQPMIFALEENAGIEIVGNVQQNVSTGEIDHSGMYIDSDCKPVHIRTVDHSLPQPALREVPMVTGACILIRRTVFEQLGGFDELYVNSCEDVDLCFRARAKGYKIAVALNSVIKHHISSSQGRKKYDELNCRRLFEHWADEVLRLSLQSRCKEEQKRFFSKRLFIALAAFLFLSGITKLPPTTLLRAQRRRIANNFRHWNTALS